MSSILLELYEITPGNDLVNVRWDKHEGFQVLHLVKVQDSRYGEVYTTQTSRTYGTEKGARAAGKRLYKKLMDENRKIGRSGKRKKKNPPKTKIRKLSPNTEKMVGQMIDLMVKRPDSQWHPSLFSIGNRLRANVPPAVRYLKEMGMIEVAYKNIDNQPVYTATAAFKEAAGVKRNPELKDLYGGTATQQINTVAQILSDEGFTKLTHREAIHALDTIGLPRSYAKKLKDKVAKMNMKRK